MVYNILLKKGGFVIVIQTVFSFDGLFSHLTTDNSYDFRALTELLISNLTYLGVVYL